MATIIRLGTMYFGDSPVKPGAPYKGNGLSIRDTTDGNAVQWIVPHGDFVIANKCVCVDISWDQLNEIGFVYGKPIQIDGRWYLCRCLKVGSRRNVPNEWDTVLNVVGDDAGLWNTEGHLFWGQERTEYRPLNGVGRRAVRGWEYPGAWDDQMENTHDIFVGFRPILMPLEPLPKDFESLVGTPVSLVGPDWDYITGKLTDVTDYDLILEPDVLEKELPWAVPNYGKIVIDKAVISWLKGNIIIR